MSVEFDTTQPHTPTQLRYQAPTGGYYTGSFCVFLGEKESLYIGKARTVEKTITRTEPRFWEFWKRAVEVTTIKEVPTPLEEKDVKDISLHRING